MDFLLYCLAHEMHFESPACKPHSPQPQLSPKSSHHQHIMALLGPVSLMLMCCQETVPQDGGQRHTSHLQVWGAERVLAHENTADLSVLALSVLILQRRQQTFSALWEKELCRCHSYSWAGGALLGSPSLTSQLGGSG